MGLWGFSGLWGFIYIYIYIHIYIYRGFGGFGVQRLREFRDVQGFGFRGL